MWHTKKWQVLVEMSSYNLIGCILRERITVIAKLTRLGSLDILSFV